MFALFLVVEAGLTVAPPLSGTKVTVAPVVSNKEPLITTVDVVPPSTGITPEEAAEAPSTSTVVIVGGLSIAFQSVPSKYSMRFVVVLNLKVPEP